MTTSCVGDCVTCLKVNYSLFKGLSDSELQLLNKGRKRYNYDKGDYLYREGTEPKGLLCLNKGKVKLIRKGKIEDEFIIGLHKPVDFIGFDDLMGNRNYTASAIAIEPTTICLIKKEILFDIIKGNSELSLKIILDLAEKTKTIKEKLINLTQNTLNARLAYTLKELQEFYGFEKDNKTIAIQMKRREIAAFSNMTTANVIRTLSNFKKLKLIEIDGKKIIIIDKNKLFSIIPSLTNNNN